MEALFEFLAAADLSVVLSLSSALANVARASNIVEGIYILVDNLLRA